jgi:hypothetical protein
MLEPHLAGKKHQGDTLNPQPIQSVSTPYYTEKTGGLLHHQMQFQTCLGDIWHTLKDLKAYIHSNTVVVEDFNTLLSQTDRSSKQKINEEILKPNT